MRKILVLCLSSLLVVGAVIVPASIVADDSGLGVTRTPVEGVDNWGWQGGPESKPTITCPGGELVGFPPDCADSTTDRLHLRDGAGWGCMTANDLRMTGISQYTSNWNFDADSNGPVWGEWKAVPIVDCSKDAAYAEAYEDLLELATSFWHGTWNGQRQFDPDKNAWISELRVDAKGFGDLDGLHFKGTMWITTFTPFPIPYEYIFLYGSPGFDMPEAYFIGTITE
jgi:hypothetical protein